MSTERFMSHVEGIRETGVEGIVVFEYPYLTDTDIVAMKII